MSNDFYYVSVVITSHSRTISNELLRLERPFDSDEAEVYEELLAEWIKKVPIPGERSEPVWPTVVDPATVLAEQLPHILDRSRDAELYENPDRDLEAQEARIQRRPYDGSKNF